jgi:hypothetical protein
MNFCWKKLKSLIFRKPLLSFFVLFLLSFVLINQLNLNPAPIELTKEEKEFQAYCNSSSEWIQLIHRKAYVRPQSNFYFVDRKVFRLSVMHNTDFKWNENEIFIKYYFKYNQREYSPSPNGKQIKLIRTPAIGFSDYQFTIFEHEFDLVSFFQLDDEQQLLNSDLNFMFIYGYSRTEFMQAKPAHFAIDSSKKKASIFCTDIVYVEPNELNDFQMWIELNNRVGHAVAFYNHSIPFNSNFNDYMKESQSQTAKHLFQLQCIPNLAKISSLQNKDFLQVKTDLLGPQSYYYIPSTRQLFVDALEHLLINECMHLFADTYNHVFIGGIDDLIVPYSSDSIGAPNKLIEQLSESEFDGEHLKNLISHESICQTGNSSDVNLSSYLTEIKNKHKISNESQIWFKSVEYFQMNELDIVMEKLRDKVDTESNQIKFSYVQRFKEKTYLKQFDLLINSTRDRFYAKNLIQIYDSILKPYINQNAQFISKLKTFDRFVYAIEPYNEMRYGKAFRIPIPGKFTNAHLSPKQKVVPLNDNYVLSHFREPKNSSKIVFPITKIVFDLTYFKCFFNKSHF